MEIIKTIKDYWAIIIFLLGIFSGLFLFIKSAIEAIKCSLRNDILEIYDRCKDKKEITQYQLHAILYSYSIYKKLKGNSFVEDIIERVKQFTLID